MVCMSVCVCAWVCVCVFVCLFVYASEKPFSLAEHYTDLYETSYKHHDTRRHTTIPTIRNVEWRTTEIPRTGQTLVPFNSAPSDDAQQQIPIKRETLVLCLSALFYTALVPWCQCDPSPLWLTFFFFLNCHEYWHRLLCIYRTTFLTMSHTFARLCVFPFIFYLCLFPLRDKWTP